MKRTIINPADLARPSGFNHGILVEGGRLLFLAGQDAGDAEGGLVGAGDLVAQCEQILKNLKSVVEEAGGSLTDIVKLNIFVCDRNAYRVQLAALGKLFRSYFGKYYPAMALFEVSGLFREEALIELEGIAVLPSLS